MPSVLSSAVCCELVMGNVRGVANFVIIVIFSGVYCLAKNMDNNESEPDMYVCMYVCTLWFYIPIAQILLNALVAG